MENFIIYDEGRNLYAVHPAGEECFYASGEVLSLQGGISVESQSEVRSEVHSEDTRADGKYGVSETEQYYRDLFCHFCMSLGIKERENWELQRNMLPLRFRPYMTGFQGGKDV